MLPQLLLPPFLSEVDAGLTRTSSRDPLGFEVLWTWYGRQVVPHLSTVSNGATNFVVLMALLHEVDAFLHDHPTEHLSRTDLIVCAESFHVYSVLQTAPELTSRLLGRYAASHHLAGGTARIGPAHPVLVSQANLGLFGRYIQPLISMGLARSDSQSLTQPAVDALAPLAELMRAIRPPLRQLFHEILNAKDHSAPFEQPAEAMAELRRPASVAAMSPLLMNALGVKPGSPTLVREAFEALARFGAPRDVLESLADRQPVQDATRLEEVLMRFDWLFERLFSEATVAAVAGQPAVRDAAGWLRSEGSQRLATLLERPPESGVAQQRLRRLNRVVQNDPEPLLEALLAHHEAVMKVRKRQPWLARGAHGELLIVRADVDSAEAPRWRRTYYIPTLADFRADLVAAGVA